MCLLRRVNFELYPMLDEEPCCALYGSTIPVVFETCDLDGMECIGGCLETELDVDGSPFVCDVVLVVAVTGVDWLAAELTVFPA
ncbi:hypothetical protein Nepgr_033922 [Nepenthes gracilis]|uniref:Uncharacterized protein n=1 Tax=Nepenthes gracilis TaxID=150966 RepID=A0AAD3TN51_NEPGR|nr:hypothetical protein Nepgr_033922 [Nepenthes gracilis]